MSASDFHLSLVDLRRTPGAIKEFSLEGCFDQETESGMVRLPAKRVVRIEGCLESVSDGVLLTGFVSATVDAQCSRCLTAITRMTEVDLQELFVYPEKAQDYTEADVHFIHGEVIDLVDAVRDAIILDQPLIPLCSDQCRGLCPSCGGDMNADPDHSCGETIDSRWLTLTEWGKMT
jgi:uncharacterized protein